MKSLLGGGALVLVMAAGAWSSDVVSGPDEPEQSGQHQRDREGRGDRAKKPHPHGEPPGRAQRDRGEPPPWSAGPDERSEEPPGLARTGPRD